MPNKNLLDEIADITRGISETAGENIKLKNDLIDNRHHIKKLENQVSILELNVVSKDKQIEIMENQLTELRKFASNFALCSAFDDPATASSNNDSSVDLKELKGFSTDNRKSHSADIQMFQDDVKKKAESAKEAKAMEMELELLKNQLRLSQLLVEGKEREIQSAESKMKDLREINGELERKLVLMEGFTEKENEFKEKIHQLQDEMKRLKVSNATLLQDNAFLKRTQTSNQFTQNLESKVEKLSEDNSQLQRMLMSSRQREKDMRGSNDQLVADKLAVEQQLILMTEQLNERRARGNFIRSPELKESIETSISTLRSKYLKNS